MLVHKRHTIQLLPNNKQKSKFRQWCGITRWTYNWGLETKIREYQETKKSSGAYALSKKIVQMKHSTHPWLADAPRSIPRVALRHLERAYINFFRRIKNGETNKGFPRFKSKKHSKTIFYLEVDCIKVKKKKVRIPKLGWMRITNPLRFKGELVDIVAIYEKAGKWYISFAVKTEHIPIENQDRSVGIDLGIKTLATLSDDTKFENPKALQQHRKLLVRAQRQLARKKKGSNRWKKAKLRVQRIYKRIADIRADATHKATSFIVSNYSLIAMEDLNVAGMMKNHHLARAIADANFYEFRRQITYKAMWNERTVGFVSQWFPSSKTCSVCGCINDNLTLKDREWQCPDCGVCHDRDVNAAKNILKKILTDGSTVTARGGIGVSTLPKKRERGNVNKSPTHELSWAQVNTI